MFRSFVVAQSSAAPATSSAVPNLVPEQPATSANYWCTWYAQNYWQQRGGEIKDFKAINNPNAREELTYKHLYDPEEGWATTYLSRGRSDFFFLIDHGWQTKDEKSQMPGSKEFFSLQIDENDFPQYADIQYWKIDGGGIRNFYSYKIKQENCVSCAIVMYSEPMMLHRFWYPPQPCGAFTTFWNRPRISLSISPG